MAWVRCGVYGLCGSMVQVVVKVCVTLCKCGSGVRGMVQMQSRCGWSSVVGGSCGCVVCGMVQGWLSIGSVVVQLNVCVAWLRCGAVVCGSVLQVVVQLCATLFRGGSGVHGMVQMWFRCVWYSVVGCGQVMV